MQGMPDKLAQEPLNLADDHRIQCSYGRKRAVFKNWPDTLFINWYYGGRVGSPFLLTTSLKWCYLVLQGTRMSPKCFWKMSLESKAIRRKFT